MNCDRPMIAVRKAGINPATGSGYKPHTFIKWRSDEQFTNLYFELKRFDRDIIVSDRLKQMDLITGEEHSYLSRHVEKDQEIFLIPCGKCLQCIQNFRRAWSIRCINEAQLSNGGVFLTLTCSDESLPRTFPGGSLDHRPFQLFMKRLRRRIDEMIPLAGKDYPLRYFMCGEYGERSGRPHYHVILFGYDFPHRYMVGRSESGAVLYSSPLLDELRYDHKKEVFGIVSNFSDVSPYDISYTCGYVDKKLGNRDPGYYARLELNTGIKLMPEYIRMSRRPGIGADWIRKYYGDVWKFYNDLCIADRVNYYGTIYQTPRYYFDQAKIHSCISPEKFDIIKAHKRDRSSLVSSDPRLFLDSLKRAHDREQIKISQLSSKVRRQF